MIFGDRKGVYNMPMWTFQCHLWQCHFYKSTYKNKYVNNFQQKIPPKKLFSKYLLVQSTAFVNNVDTSFLLIKCR